VTETLHWQWDQRSESYANYGNANQWTVNAGLESLGREATQNTNDARVSSNAEMVFTFIRLTDEHRKAFEQALGWDAELRPHLESMSSSSGGAVSAGQIKRGLEDLQNSQPLLLLRIADYGCVGLTGPEFPKHNMAETEFGNFIKLCRLDLFSGKDQAAGGSFGLGKAVYWRFSRVQTVLFNSTVAPDAGVDGKHRNRLLGVNQGVVHTLGNVGYVGRGFFGEGADDSLVRSAWDGQALVDQLCLTRKDERTGTSALIVGFYDPDRPDLGSSDLNDVTGTLVHELEVAIETHFWPLLTRKRLKVRIEVEDNGVRVAESVVDPRNSYPELVTALTKFDADDVSSTLTDLGQIVVKDISVEVAKRKDEVPHERFIHDAKLVVTLSDDEKDSLENRVVLFRRSEMLVETLDKTFEGMTYHAFLVAGGAINPGNSTQAELLADDFLRFAEPPAHDRWIPGGRAQASQANLTARYTPPWVPNLTKIRDEILKALESIFEPAPPDTDAPPDSVLRHLRFMSGGKGNTSSSGAAHRKPTVDVTSAAVEDGRVRVGFTVRVKNRPEGWSMVPQLTFRGLDGGGEKIPWESISATGVGEWHDGRLVIPGIAKGRFLKAALSGLSTLDLPIPASEAGIEVRVVSVDVAPEGEGAS
jgi:hypothetical protein